MPPRLSRLPAQVRQEPYCDDSVYNAVHAMATQTGDMPLRSDRVIRLQWTLRLVLLVRTSPCRISKTASLTCTTAHQTTTSDLALKTTMASRPSAPRRPTVSPAMPIYHTIIVLLVYTHRYRRQVALPDGTDGALTILAARLLFALPLRQVCCA